MKLKRVLITIGSLAVVSGLLVGCTTTASLDDGAIDSKVNEKVQDKDVQNDKEREEKTFLKIETIEGNKITASVLEMTKPTDAPKSDSSNDDDQDINYELTGEVIAFTVDDETKYKSFLDEDESIRTLDDLVIGDIVSIELDENNVADEIYSGGLQRFTDDKDHQEKKDIK